MYTPLHVIQLIEDDAPAVYDRLRDAYFTEYGDGSAPPTAEELIEQLEKYSGDCYDCHLKWARTLIDFSLSRYQHHIGMQFYFLSNSLYENTLLTSRPS